MQKSYMKDKQSNLQMAEEQFLRIALQTRAMHNKEMMEAILDHFQPFLAMVSQALFDTINRKVKWIDINIDSRLLLVGLVECKVGDIIQSEDGELEITEDNVTQVVRKMQLSMDPTALQYDSVDDFKAVITSGKAPSSSSNTQLKYLVESLGFNADALSVSDMKSILAFTATNIQHKH